MAPEILAFDHIHIYVSNRDAAEAWYREVLGFTRTRELEVWAIDGGPLTLQNPRGTVHLALFEGPAQPCRSTIALSISGQDFPAWKSHLEKSTGCSPEIEDHGLSISLYFSDPDGNPFELTTYECEDAREGISAP